jgi:hypothetical protein
MKRNMDYSFFVEMFINKTGAQSPGRKAEKALLFWHQAVGILGEEASR